MDDVHGESADAGEDDEGASLAKRDHACLCHLQTQCKLFQDRGNHSSKGEALVAARRAMLEKKAPLSPGRNLCRCPVTTGALFLDASSHIRLRAWANPTWASQMTYNGLYCLICVFQIMCKQGCSRTCL